MRLADDIAAARDTDLLGEAMLDLLSARLAAYGVSVGRRDWRSLDLEQKAERVNNALDRLVERHLPLAPNAFPPAGHDRARPARNRPAQT
ncbi:hypothetical protein SLNSH_18545 [Alsobacter soli]|uniref:Uncharacterized protein n=1 Tax=Alsobacter soli TaxID=2109933 RepID=A0A2T1HPE3_9HYPH|nr:hypothetical protein [Alsobacter soli]PSC03511.1 hypothetical protein SLNSH_18545 [Alsobacter soli]